MECFKWGLTDHSIRNVKDIGAEGDFNFWRPGLRGFRGVELYYVV